MMFESPISQTCWVVGSPKYGYLLLKHARQVAIAAGAEGIVRIDQAEEILKGLVD